MTPPSAAPGPILPRDHPLAGCEAKFWRAHELFEVLQQDIRENYGTGSVQFVSFRREMKPGTQNQFRYVISEVFDPPLRYATIIGDIVHNLRSILDHLVFELAFLGEKGTVIPRKVAFPCSTTHANWNSPHVQKTMLAGIMKKHRAMLYRTQPCYRRKDAPSNPRTLKRRKPHPIADLENFWNHDKHRTLQPVAVAALLMHGTVTEVHDCQIIGVPRFNRGAFGRRFEVGTELLTVHIQQIGSNPDVLVNFEGEGEISFENGLPTRLALAFIADWVKSILSWFGPEFETPAARRLWGLSRGGWMQTPRTRRQKTWVTGDEPHERPSWWTPPS
jgi:hypothetical protein